MPPRSDFAGLCDSGAVEHCTHAGHFRRDVAVSNSFLGILLARHEGSMEFNEEPINMTGEHISVM